MHNNSRILRSLRTYDSRVKLYIMVLFVITNLVGWKWHSIIPAMALLFFIIYVSEIKLSELIGTSLNAVLISLIVSLILILTISLKIGILVLFKMLMITFAFISISHATRQTELLDALSTGFGLKAEASKMISAILSFLPHLKREKKRVRLAQKARGVDPDEGNMFVRFRKDLMLAIPNYKCNLLKTKRQLETMEMRQYTSVRRRKPLHTLKYTWVDDVVMILNVIIFLITVLLMIIF